MLPKSSSCLLWLDNSPWFAAKGSGKGAADGERAMELLGVAPSGRAPGATNEGVVRSCCDATGGSTLLVVDAAAATSRLGCSTAGVDTASSDEVSFDASVPGAFEYAVSSIGAAFGVAVDPANASWSVGAAPTSKVRRVKEQTSQTSPSRVPQGNSCGRCRRGGSEVKEVAVAGECGKVHRKLRLSGTRSARVTAHRPCAHERRKREGNREVNRERDDGNK